MKTLILIGLVLLSSLTKAEDIFVLHYMGDAQPIILNLDNKSKNAFTDNFITKLIINFDKTTTLGLNADFNIIRSKEKLTIKAKSINKSIVLITTENNPSDTMTATVKFIDSERIFSPVKNGMTPLKMTGKIMSFYSGILDDESLFNLHLNIAKKHLLGKDEIIFDRNIKHSEYTAEKISENRSLVSIDLNKITDGAIEDNHSYAITTSIELTYPTQNVANLEQLGPTLISKNIDIRAQ